MKWIRTALCALGMLACLSLSAFAAEFGEPNITEQTTMKELRENPSIKGSGFYTYCNEWIEGSTKYDNTPIKGYVSWAASEDAAEGMNLVIENYNKGVQVTWQVYTPEEIEADPALGISRGWEAERLAISSFIRSRMALSESRVRANRALSTMSPVSSRALCR